MQSILRSADIPKKVNEQLEEFFQRSVEQAQIIHPDYARLWQTIHTLSSAGGKRLRPQMTVLAYEVFGGQDTDSVIPVAAAQELLHLSLLIHDDIIDRDDIRYGVPNIVGTYLNTYGSRVADPQERRHYSQSAAILGGDVLLSGAYQLITHSTLPDSQKIMAMSLLGSGIFAVCGGELLDTEAAFKAFEETDALLIARYKTASYSFSTPLVTGASLAGATEHQLALLHEYSETLGTAYQLTDDIIGCFGDEEITGKSSYGDIREGKHTFLIEKHLATLSDTQAEEFWRVFGNSTASQEEIESLKKAIIQSGAKDATEQYVENLANRARQLIQQMNIADDRTVALEQLIDKATKRVF